jgi:hypothetical protein
LVMRGSGFIVRRTPTAILAVRHPRVCIESCGDTQRRGSGDAKSCNFKDDPGVHA